MFSRFVFLLSRQENDLPELNFRNGNANEADKFDSDHVIAALKRQVTKNEKYKIKYSL